MDKRSPGGADRGSRRERSRSRRAEGREARGPYHHGSLREALVEGGLALLARTGPAGFSLRALAQELGVSHAAPYRHFASREELLVEIVAESRRRFNEALEASVSGPEPDAEKIYLLGEAYVRFFLARPQVLYLFGVLPGQLAAEGEELGRMLFAEAGAGGEGEALMRDPGFGLLRRTVAGLRDRFPGLGEREVLLGYWAKAHGLATLLAAQPDFFAPGDPAAGLRRVLRQAF